MANLATGCWFFLRFVKAIKAITEEERHSYFEEAWDAIGVAAAAQEQYQRNARPELRFLRLLCSAVTSGECHIADADGERPNNQKIASANGWRRKRLLSGTHWEAMGSRIGWIDGDDLFLDPSSSFKTAQEMARHGERIPVGEKTLHKRMADSGLLASTEQGRGKLTVRKELEGKRRSVLHVKSGTLCQEE